MLSARSRRAVVSAPILKQLRAPQRQVTAPLAQPPRQAWRSSGWGDRGQLGHSSAPQLVFNVSGLTSLTLVLPWPGTALSSLERTCWSQDRAVDQLVVAGAKVCGKVVETGGERQP